MAGAGLAYYLSGTTSESVYPSLLAVERRWGPLHQQRHMVRFHRTIDDDLGLSPLGIMGLEPQWILRRALSDFEIIRELGGLYVFAYHTQGFGTPEYVRMVADLSEELRRRGSWIATGREMADWWKMRHEIAVSMTEPSPGTIQVSVISHAREQLNEVALSVYPTDNTQGWMLDSSGTGGVGLAPDETGEALRLMLGPLEPSKTNNYRLTREGRIPEGSRPSGGTAGATHD